MAERVLGIEIGPKLTKVVETDYKSNNYKMYSFFIFQTPEGTIENGIVSNNNQFRALLEQGLKTNKIKTRKTVFAIQSSKIGTKEEELPMMKDNKLKEHLKTDIRSYFPVDPEHYQIAYRVNGPGTEGSNRMQLFAVPEDIVISYESLADFCDLSLMALELVDNGVAKVLQSIQTEQTIAHVAVDENSTTITVVNQGHVTMQRSVPYGIDDAITALQEESLLGEELSYSETIRKMHEQQCFYTRLNVEDEIEDRIKKTATDETRYILGNVNRILDYYISQHQTETIEQVYLSGVATQCKGFAELLFNEINRPIKLVTQGMIIDSKNSEGNEVGASYFGAMASTVDPIGITLSVKQKNFFTLGSGNSREDLATVRHVFIGCVIITLILVIVPLANRAALRIEQKSIQKDIDAMQDAKVVYDKYQATKEQYDELCRICKLTETPDDNLLSLYSEIEANIPTDATITSMEAEAESVTIEFSTPTKASAAKTIVAFRDFETIHSASVDQIERVDTDNAQGSYAFTLTCYYLDTPALSTSEGEDADASLNEAIKEVTEE